MNIKEVEKEVFSEEKRRIEERRTKGVLSIYHPNARGTGGALKMSIVPASFKYEGNVFMVAARQTSAPNSFPRFNWEDVICASIGPVDVARLLMVFRGECESVNDGAGIFIRFPGERCDAVRVTLRHVIEPVVGYQFEFIHTFRESGEKDAGTKTEQVRLFLGAAEALAISLALEQSMRLLAFGA